jgi:peptide/nickel transport system ATP-binding protein
LNLVSQGAGSSDTWSEMYRFDQGSAPDLIEIEPGHKVRCHV